MKSAIETIGFLNTVLTAFTFRSAAVRIVSPIERDWKETAKEIYKEVLNLRELMVNNDDSLCILRNVESWAKEEGVEVEG